MLQQKQIKPPNTSDLSKFISVSFKSPNWHAASALQCWDPGSFCLVAPPSLGFAFVCVDQHDSPTCLPSSHQDRERGWRECLLTFYDIIQNLYHHFIHIPLARTQIYGHIKLQRVREMQFYPGWPLASLYFRCYIIRETREKWILGQISSLCHSPRLWPPYYL